MFCWLLFRDAEGRLPTAQEMRRRGFRVSAAALPEADAEPAQGFALAAEDPAQYGLASERPDAAEHDGEAGG